MKHQKTLPLFFFVCLAEERKEPTSVRRKQSLTAAMLLGSQKHNPYSQFFTFPH